MRWFEGSPDCPKWERLLTLQTGRIAYDIGANGGHYSRLFARRFEHVQAWEPCVESFEKLIDDRPPNLVCHNLALSDHVGFVTLREAEWSILSGQLVTGHSHPWGDTVGWREIPCSTLDDVTSIHWLPDLVKIDVEGGELEVVAGAQALIGSKHATWFIEVHEGRFEDPLRQAFQGYTILKHMHTGYDDDDPFRREHFYMRMTP